MKSPRRQSFTLNIPCTQAVESAGRARAGDAVAVKAHLLPGVQAQHLVEVVQRTYLDGRLQHTNPRLLR
jgi:hypothetical protein